MLIFFNDTATTEIYTLSLHDALPISDGMGGPGMMESGPPPGPPAFLKQVFPPKLVMEHQQEIGLRPERPASGTDRKSTRLNSSHSQISYAVFCLKKKKQQLGISYDYI